MPEGIITIKKGREKPVIQQHPWIFSGAIANAEQANPGDIVSVHTQDGSFLARGYWNPKSQIQVRILTWEDEPINDEWWERMLTRAINGRPEFTYALANNDPYGFRVVNAENDFIPGLIIDRYDDWYVLQALTLHIDQQKSRIAEILNNIVQPAGVYERSDVDVRKNEGLPQRTGRLLGGAVPELIQISEGPRYLVDIQRGHKTGFYLDQRDNRHILTDIVNEYVGEGVCRILNLFSYTGGFAMAGLMQGGVHAVNVDASAEALDLARKNFELNEFQLNEHGTTAEFVQADVFDYMREAVERGDGYDIVVLDPPKFAHNKQQVQKASRGYKDINLNGFKLVKSGGYLMTFSCSGAISADLFQKIVFGALADSGRQAQIVKHLGPGDDHPVALTFPEGAYLKGLLLRVY